MGVDITPTTATNKKVTWSVINGTGSATINSSGLLTATGVGTVTVKALAQDGSGKDDIKVITITPSDAELLAQAKINKKALADDLLTGLTQADYTTASWTTLIDAIAADKSAIDAKPTVSEVTGYTLTATAGKAALVTLADELAQAKLDAKADLLVAFGAYSEDDYTADHNIALGYYKDQGNIAIDAATDLAEVASALGTAISNMAGVTTIEQTLATAKADLDLGYVTEIVSDMTLPTIQNGATVSWSSSDVAVISNDGTVTRPAYGELDATVTLTATITLKAKSVTKAFAVTVKAKAATQYTLTLTGDNITSTHPAGLVDKDTPVTVTVAPATGQQVATFTVGAVDRKGDLSENKYTFKITADTTVAVTYEDIKVTGVTLDNDTLSLVAGGATGTLTATVNPSDAANKSVTWSSSNEAVATVADGVVTLLSAGSTTITVTTDDGGKTATCYVTVTVKSSDASLSDLKVDGTTITGFNASTLTYNVELPAGTTTVPTVTATANDSKASAVVTNASSLPGSTTVVVTAEDGATQTYTIKFTVATDTTPPVITATDKIVPFASLAAWTETVWATDDVDGSISGNVVATYFQSDGSTSLTDLAAAKTYIGDATTNTSFVIKYNVSDLAGNAATEVAVTITVTKANVPSSVTVGSSTLNSTTPYLVDGTPATTGTLGAGNCTAHFDPITGDLSLQGYVGGVIRINEAGKNLSIKLIGDVNKITGGQFGIHNDSGDIHITSDNKASLEIDINSSYSGAGIANGWGAMTENPSVFIGGKAKVTVKAKYTGDQTTNSITGIYAGRGSVIIQDQADYSATLTNSKYQGRGISSNGKTIINTSGNIEIDVSNSLQGIGIYGNSGIEIQQVNSMLITIPSTGEVGNTKFTDGTVDVLSGVAVNKSTTKASYRSGTPYTLGLEGGNITSATGGVIGSPHQYLVDDEITIESTISEFDRWTKADGTALETALFTGSDTAESATATIKMPAANLSIKAKEKDAKISIAEIPGVTAPVTGATPVTTEVSTDQYTGTVAWSPTDNPFAAEKVYTATITLKAKSGFTLDGVAANYFTVEGATTTNTADSGVVTAAFPATAADTIVASISNVVATNGKVTITLDKKPSVAPNAADFTATSKIDSGVANTLELTGFNYDDNVTVTYTFTPVVKTDVVQKVVVAVTYNSVETLATAFEVVLAPDKEITGFTALTSIVLSSDEKIIDLAALKASGKLPTEVTVTDGTTPAQATITDWTGTFDGSLTGAKTLTAVWTMPAGYVDVVSPITVEIVVNVNVVQTPREVTGYSYIGNNYVKLTSNEKLVTLAELIASGKLPTEVTVTDGITPAQATITNWTGTYNGGLVQMNEITAVWTMPANYVDEINPITVKFYVHVDVRQIPFEGGTGSESDPYQIKTAEQLNYIRYFHEKYFIQTADIDLSAYLSGSGAGWNDGAGWEPIGKWDNSTTGFAGSYNGNNKTITGLYINRPTSDYQGLFGRTRLSTNKTKLEKIRLIDVNISGKDYIGGLSGDLAGSTTGNEKTIEKCYVSGSVSGSSNVGGLVGSNHSIIKNSNSNALVSGNSNVGGLVGINNKTIENCYAVGLVTGTGTYVGGLVGENRGVSATVTSSYYDSTTTGQSDKGKGVGETTANMKTQSTFTGWDFTNIWTIETGSYPTLR